MERRCTALRLGAALQRESGTHLRAREHQTLIELESFGADGRLSIPTPEHYLPLLYVLAQQQIGEVLSFPVDGIERGSIGMLTALVAPPVA